ncbi:hypothetical protein [Streptomyces viridosporus]|uniref:hypothetical protein n=1 Tax=Streptomyces viridosporus TaxID=67581 RepID=UPI001180A97B|nr:hypothetical protein [Streptomyces viridosporus]
MEPWHVCYEDRRTERHGEPSAGDDGVSRPPLPADADGVPGGGRRDRLTGLTRPVGRVPDGAGAVPADPRQAADRSPGAGR